MTCGAAAAESERVARTRRAAEPLAPLTGGAHQRRVEPRVGHLIAHPQLLHRGRRGGAARPLCRGVAPALLRYDKAVEHSGCEMLSMVTFLCLSHHVSERRPVLAADSQPAMATMPASAPLGASWPAQRAVARPPPPSAAPPPAPSAAPPPRRSHEDQGQEQGRHELRTPCTRHRGVSRTSRIQSRSISAASRSRSNSPSNATPYTRRERSIWSAHSSWARITSSGKRRPPPFSEKS